MIPDARHASPQGPIPFQASLTRPPEPPTADPLAEYAGILTAANRLSLMFERENPDWEGVISSYAKSVH